MMISVFDGVENLVVKEENAAHQHFLLFPQSFQKGFFLGVVKSPDCVVKSGSQCLDPYKVQVYHLKNKLQVPSIDWPPRYN